MSNLVINFFRHGEARYQQKKVSLKDANDLTSEGEKKVRKEARKLVKSVRKDEEVVIWSSPYGRTLQTARIIEGELRKAKVSFRETLRNENPFSVIKIFHAFEEVKNFNQLIFGGLVNGGGVEINGIKFVFNKKITNPDDLSWTHYYNSAFWQKIDKKYFKSIPEEIRENINSIEKNDEATKRMMRRVEVLKRVRNPKKKRRIIIVTHQGLISQYSEGSIEPGDYVELKF